MKSRVAVRLLAIGFGLVVAAVGLGLAEVALRMLGPTDSVPLHDPFAGFSSAIRTFEETVDADGAPIYRVARTRANPFRADAVLAEPQRRFSAAKAENGFRVFVVGGSSAAGVPYASRYAFSGWLEKLLAEAHPDLSVEVVNAAFSGYATRRVLTVVREVADYEPDLVIIYSGHNEFAEHRFYAHLIDLDPRVFRLWESVASTRVYQLLSRLLPVPSPGADPPQIGFEKDSTRAVQMFSVLQQRGKGEAVPSEREKVYRDLHYAFNLRQMVAAIRNVGGRVALLSIGQNLSGWAPGSSSHAPGRSSSELQQFGEHQVIGDTARGLGDCSKAIAAYETAISIDPSYAQVHFDLATCLHSLGRNTEANAQYRISSDLDGVPHGAPSAFNDVVREVASDTGSIFVDVEKALRLESGDDLVGDDLFLDMLHPNIRAHQLIARVVFGALRAAGVPAPPNTWQPTPALPSPASLYLEDPHLRFLEAQVRLVACQLANRPGCVSAAADLMRELEPDNSITDRLSSPNPAAR